MIITTTQHIEGVSVRAYLGVVTSEVVMGVNLFRDFFASVRNIVGGRAAGYEKALLHGKNQALAEIQEQAEQMGADAIIALSLDYEGVDGGMLLICASGTAVQLT